MTTWRVLFLYVITCVGPPVKSMYSPQSTTADDLSKYWGIVTTSNQVRLPGRNPVTITCQFSVKAGKHLFSIELQRRRYGESRYKMVATYSPPFPGDNRPKYTGYYGNHQLKFRARIVATDTSLSFQIHHVKCTDDAMYRCELGVYGGQVLKRVSAWMTLILKGACQTKGTSSFEARILLGSPQGIKVSTLGGNYTIFPKGKIYAIAYDKFSNRIVYSTKNGLYYTSSEGNGNTIIKRNTGVLIYGIVVFSSKWYVYSVDQIRLWNEGKDKVLLDDKRRKPFGRLTYNDGDKCLYFTYRNYKYKNIIGRTNLNGKRSTDFFKSSTKISSIAIDVPAQRLYYGTNGLVMCIHLNIVKSSSAFKFLDKTREWYMVTDMSIHRGSIYMITYGARKSSVAVHSVKTGKEEKVLDVTAVSITTNTW